MIAARGTTGGTFDPSTLAPKDLEAYNWAIKNKDNAKAKEILKRLGAE